MSCFYLKVEYNSNCRGVWALKDRRTQCLFSSTFHVFETNTHILAKSLINIHRQKDKKKRCWITFELVEDSPEFSYVSGKSDVSVQHDDSLQIWGQCLREHQFHQAVDSRVMFIRDPRHFRLKQYSKVWVNLLLNWLKWKVSSLHID